MLSSIHDAIVQMPFVHISSLIELTTLLAQHLSPLTKSPECLRVIKDLIKFLVLPLILDLLIDLLLDSRRLPLIPVVSFIKVFHCNLF